jgi:hypothetical protein
MISCQNSSDSKKTIAIISIDTMDLEILRTVVMNDSIQMTGDSENSFPILDIYEPSIIDSVLLSDTSINSIFTIEDFKYFNTQVMDFKPKKIQSSEFYTIPKDSIDKFIDHLENHQENLNYGLIYYSFSKPIYSKDHSKCLITVNHCCINLLCGSSETLILIKSKDKWKIQKHITHWVG